MAPNPHWSAVQLNYRPPRRESYKISLAVVYTVDEMSVDKMPADEMSADEMSLDKMPADEISIDSMSLI